MNSSIAILDSVPYKSSAGFAQNACFAQKVDIGYLGNPLHGRQELRVREGGTVDICAKVLRTNGEDSSRLN